MYMDTWHITELHFRELLVQCALSQAQQETLAHIFELSPPPLDAYDQLKAKLTCLQQKDSCTRLSGRARGCHKPIFLCF